MKTAETGNRKGLVIIVKILSRAISIKQNLEIWNHNLIAHQQVLHRFAHFIRTSDKSKEKFSIYILLQYINNVN